MRPDSSCSVKGLLSTQLQTWQKTSKLSRQELRPGRVAHAVRVPLPLALHAHLVGFTAQGTEHVNDFHVEQTSLNQGLSCGSFPSPSIHRLKMSWLFFIISSHTYTQPLKPSKKSSRAEV